jgi:hypothetical protein
MHLTQLKARGTTASSKKNPVPVLSFTRLYALGTSAYCRTAKKKLEENREKARRESPYENRILHQQLQKHHHLVVEEKEKENTKEEDTPRPIRRFLRPPPPEEKEDEEEEDDHDDDDELSRQIQDLAEKISRIKGAASEKYLQSLFHN